MASDKHMEVARQLVDSIDINERGWPADYERHAAAIATALANAEREGMKRAADIAKGRQAEIEAQAAAHGDPGMNFVVSTSAMRHEAKRIEAAILAEAGEPAQ